MKKYACLLLVLFLSFSILSASAGTIPLKGYDPNGEEVSVTVPEDVRLILLECWEPWCIYCRRDMPALNQLYVKYRDQGLLVIGAFSSTDVNRQTLFRTAWELAEDAGVTYPILRFPAEFFSTLVNGVPVIYILDKDGCILPFTDEDKITIMEIALINAILSSWENTEKPEDRADYGTELLFLNDAQFRHAVTEVYVKNLPDNYDYASVASLSAWEAVISARLSALTDTAGTVAPADVSPSSVSTGYTVTVTYEDGTPVPGVSVQMCPEGRCILRKTREDGTVLFEDVAPGFNEFHLYNIPDGCKPVEDIPSHTIAEVTDIRIVLRKSN